MRETNITTLQSYENHVQEYITQTPSEVKGELKTWINASLENLPLDARIIEIGSAFGRDANYIESQGYRVERTDAAERFVAWLNDNGYPAERFNLLSDEFDEKYDLIFADAVLLHFSRDEMEAALVKINHSLQPQGRFAFTLKQGEGEGWSSAKLNAPRYFCYWTTEQIKALLDSSGFSEVAITETTLANDSSWLHIVARC